MFLMKLLNVLSRRRRESLFLLLSLMYVIVISVVYMVGKKVPFTSAFLPIIAAWSAFLVCHIVLNILDSNQDQNILPLISVLVITGTVTILNIAPELVMRHLISIYVGLLGFCGILLIYRFIHPEKMVKILVSSILVLLFATLAFGSKRGGATSWIMFGSYGFQPSEIVKLLLILINAVLIVRMNKAFGSSEAVIHSKELKKLKDAWLISSLWAATMCLLVFQNDFGMTLVYYLTCLMMALIATGNMRVLATGIAVGSVAGTVSVLSFAHITARFTAWINPWASPNGSGYQILQSMFTLANGGIFGKGFSGENAKYLPASITDMNFAVIGEEFGFIGLVALVLCIFLIVRRGFASASKEDNMIYSLVKAGVSAFLGIQSFIIIAGNLRILPLTGITIPFISFGGTSMVVSMTMVGMLFISSKKGMVEDKEILRGEHMKGSIKILNKIWAAACVVLIIGCAYIQVYSRERLVNDVYNPRIIRSNQEAFK